MNFILRLILISGYLWLTGCQGTRHLPANEKLYTGASVKVEGPDLNSKQKKVLRNDLAGLTRPKPNTSFLGMRPKLAFYNTFRNAKKGFFKNLRDKWGEPPVLFSQVDLQKNTQVLQSYAENKGWFHAKVTSDTIVRKKTAKAEYLVETGNQYKINEVSYPTDSSDLARAIAATVPNTLLVKGAPFDLDVIKAERQRIDANLKEKGFYFFSPEYLLVRTDSTIGNHQVNMAVVVKPETPENATAIHRINDVFIYSGYAINADRFDTIKTHAENFNGYNIIDRRKRFKPFLFDETMQFRPGEVYNRTDHNRTLSRLINLNLFKFVKNRFEVAPATDTAQLDVYYYLTPLPRQSLRAEFSVVTRSNNLNGSQINFNWSNRNLFRNGSQINVNAYVGSDVQFSGALKGYNTYRFGGEVVYAIPRFLLPFKKVSMKGPYAPRTNISVGYDVLNRKNLYTINSYRFEHGYEWKKNIQKQHQLYPISITYAEPLNVTQEFKDLQKDIPGFERAVEPQFILGSRYQYIYNQMANDVQPKMAWYFNGVVDLSGNIAGLVTGANVKKGDTVRIGNLPFSQYIKLEADLRNYLKVGLKSTWVNRINIGYGQPYGNSSQIPYIKQFFIGGNNSLRGFRSRSVGPGTYFPISPTNFLPDQTGDIKFEVNSEFRPHIAGPLYGALFIDAGNIWLASDSTHTKKPGAQFTSKFLNQLAVDVGVGIRLDITIFVIRLDVGFPIRKPWEIPPSVLNQVSFRDPVWRRQNLVYNLAIGYPF